MGDPRPPIHVLAALVLVEILVDVPERALVDWVNRHAGVIPPVEVLLVATAGNDIEFGGAS
jgi:hypothetical protein